MNDIRWLTGRLPSFQRIVIRGESDYYGVSWQIATALGRPFPPLSYASWRHGWIYYQPLVHPKRVAMYGSPEDIHLVHTEEHVQFLRSHGYKKVFAVGMPFLYAPAVTTERQQGSLLVMPRHITPYIGLEINQEEYADYISTLKHRFDKIVLCVSGACAEHGMWTEAFRRVGIPYIIGADINDRNALPRMRTIFQSFEFMTTHNLGSHVPYAAFCGCKISIAGAYASSENTDYRREPFYREHPEILRDNIRDSSESAIRRRFPHLFVHPPDALEQRDWGEEMLATKHQQPPGEIARLLGWGRVRQFLGRHEITPTLSRATPAQIRRSLIRAVPAAASGYHAWRRSRNRSPVDSVDAFGRLRRDLRNKPRYLRGTYRFSWGAVQYVDARSLESQYQEIFVNRGYEFTTDSSAPRIFDCGGNIGLSVLWFKQRYPQARITVIEADPDLVSALRENLQTAGLSDVDVQHAAVWDSAGTIEFNAEGADAGSVCTSGRGLVVPTLRLSDQIHEAVDLLKLDVEGAEYKVIDELAASGMLSLIRRIAAELHRRGDAQAELACLLSTLDKFGFAYTLTHARTAVDLPGKHEPTPFTTAGDAKCLIHLYAWQPFA